MGPVRLRGALVPTPKPWAVGVVSAGMSPLCVLVALVSAPGYYQPARAELPIATKLYELNDKVQRKVLPLRMTYPTSGGPGPVIVFSHGMYGSRDGYQPLAAVWAKAGYVVIQPTHEDSLVYMSQEDKLKLMRRPNTNNTKSWSSRPFDIKCVIDNLVELDRAIGGHMDRTRIGMGGHSFGAWTTQVVAGMRLAPGERAASMADPRPQAFLVISPQGTKGAITKSSFAKMRGPMMMISGDKDIVPPQTDAQWRKEAFEGSPTGGGRWLLWIKDATHMFGGFSHTEARPGRQIALLGRDPGKPEHKEIVLSESLAFWDATLRKDAAALRHLESKAIEGTKMATLTER